MENLKEESVISIYGKVKKEERAPQGAEVHVEKIEIISKVTEDLPITINKKEFNINLDTLLDNRTLALRNPKQRAIFRVQGEVMKAFRCFFEEKEFVEINTPKIVSAGAETGGAEMFSMKYFKKRSAYLAQSPQLYKQIMVGVFERVFETAYVYRAEPSATTRHISEYLSLDAEMGFIESWTDLIDIYQEFIKYLIDRLKKNCQEEFDFL
ncbi:aspartate--tRNA(Asn) ligase, partial [bacterium (Candidatus Howlettbacteria) CG_4_10_14_0_8_um_filter_40_9]